MKMDSTEENEKEGLTWATDTAEDLVGDNF